MVVDPSKTPTIPEKREVVIGTRKPGKVEIIKGLSEGEKFVTHGTMNARPGQPVNIMAEEQGGEKLSDILKNAENKTPEAKKGKE